MIPQITFFNTLTNQEEAFKPIDSNHLKIYVCGPTVYDRPHLGNARSVVIYDLLFRFLRQVFLQVTYVRNITDVDDKINAAAKEQGVSIQNLTQKITEFFPRVQHFCNEFQTRQCCLFQIYFYSN